MEMIMGDTYGYDVWDIEDIPQTDEDIWILGTKYKYDDLEEIRDDVRSKLWCTYRKGFTPLGSPQYTSDRGFGCMLRCGQMLLAEALTRIHIGRHWRWQPETKDPTYLKIIKRFEDTKTAPFGIHQIALMGQDAGKKISEWYSPNVIAQVIKKLVRFDDFTKLNVHVALDHQLATDEIVELSDDATFQPLLLIIPLRLGLNEINPIYIDGLKKCLQFECTLGIIGGKPNQALYFIGYVGNEALYLDPHTCQRSGIIGSKDNQQEMELDETFHQKFAARINFTAFDPSIAVCFLCQSQAEFDGLMSRFQTDIVDAGLTPLFEIIKSRARPWISSSCSSRDLEQDLGVICGDQPVEDFEELKKLEGSDDEFEIID